MTVPSQDSNPTEQQRVEALASTGLFGTAPEAEFDEIVRLASTLCGVPISAMTLLDRSSTYVKSAVGMPNSTIPREHAFCDHTVREGRVFTISDTRADARFVSNPLVTSEPHIRFYRGVPLHTEDGSAVGALCVLDTCPRSLTDEQEWALEVLARQLSTRIQLRARIRAMEEQSAELHKQRELFQLFLDSLPLEAYVKDEKGHILFYNRCVAERFDVDRQAWLGKTSHDLWPAERADLIRMEDEYVMQTGQMHESYVELPTPTGEVDYWKVIKAPFRMETGEQILANVGVNLTSELQREAELVKLQEKLEDANRKLRSLSLTDELTGLWNRRAFDSRIETAVFEAEHTRTPLTLLMIDVDSFKALNDTFGHAHGDEVLAQVGDVIRRAVRTEDVAVRYGGEEFAVIMPGADTTGGQVLSKRINRMLDSVRWKYRPVTVSIGIASHARDLSSDDLLNMADQAMYRAKRNGKNCSIAFEREWLEQATSERP